jgi:hypothetical protein
MLNWLVRMSAEFESNITSVERIREYIDQDEHEVRSNWSQIGEIFFALTNSFFVFVEQLDN